MKKDILDQILEASSVEEVDKLLEEYNTDQPIDEAPEPDPNSLVSEGDDMDKDLKKMDDEMKKMGPGGSSSSSSSSGIKESGLDLSVEFLTEGELMSIYSECVAEVIRESKAKIDAKYKTKRDQAKKFKKKKIAEKKLKDEELNLKSGKKKVKASDECSKLESTNFNDMMDQLFGI